MLTDQHVTSKRFRQLAIGRVLLLCQRWQALRGLCPSPHTGVGAPCTRRIRTGKFRQGTVENLSLGVVTTVTGRGWEYYINKMYNSVLSPRIENVG